MFYGAKGGSVYIGGTCVDYIAFGSGGALVMLPGLSDGLRTVKGTAPLLAVMYRVFAKRFRVYVFSRRNALPHGFSTRAMAADVARAMDALDIRSAPVMGVSQGGMIAQWLAADYPAKTEQLVLAVTASRPNAVLKETVGHWLELARRGDYGQLMYDTALKSYSDAYLNARRALLPLLGLAGRPLSFDRFIVQAEACLAHSAYDRLDKIKCPSLVLGGGEDKVVGVQASRELAGKLRGSELYIYDGLGHAAYQEAKDFNERVLDFLTK